MLPTKYDRLHDIFLVQLLKEYKPKDRQPLIPLPDLDDDDDEYEVEEVKDEAILKGEKYYLMKQEGQPTEYNLWVPLRDIGNVPEAIRKFEKRKAKEAKNKTK